MSGWVGVSYLSKQVSEDDDSEKHENESCGTLGENNLDGGGRGYAWVRVRVRVRV